MLLILIREPGSGAFLTLGSGIGRIPDPKPIFLRASLANAPVCVEPGPGSCGRCCGEEPRLAARTGGQGGRRKDPNTIHGEPLL